MGKNQFSNRDWDSIPWEELSLGARRARLFKEANFACSECGYSKCRPDGKMILEIDHIDSDHTNNDRSNLRVLCPNCHALTPNYRNHGRGAGKTSKRFRKGNTGYAAAMELIAEQKRAYIENFKNTVLKAHEDGTIDFSNPGWGQPLADLIGDKYNPTKKRVINLMPEFYAEHCYNRAKRFSKNQINEEVQAALHEQRQATLSALKETVLETFTSGEIDYSKFGWTAKLANKLGESGQTIGKRVRRIMPEFFIQHCFTKGPHRNLK